MVVRPDSVDVATLRGVAAIDGDPAFVAEDGAGGIVEDACGLAKRLAAVGRAPDGNAGVVVMSIECGGIGLASVAEGEDRIRGDIAPWEAWQRAAILPGAAAV